MPRDDVHALVKLHRVFGGQVDLNDTVAVVGDGELLVGEQVRLVGDAVLLFVVDHAQVALRHQRRLRVGEGQAASELSPR